MAKTLGEKLTELRKRRNATQEQVAEQFGVSAQAVSKWENDQSCPDILMMPSIADYYNTTLDELMRDQYEQSVKLVPVEERKDMNQMILRVIVDSHEGDKVRVNLPMSLVKVALDIGMQIPEISSRIPIKDIDFSAILLAASNGIVGKFVEVETVDGDKVDIYIE